MLIGPQNSPPVGQLAAQLARVRERLAAAAQVAGRNADCVTLLAVTKGRGSAAVQELARLGVRHFGESYLQEALPKLDALADAPPGGAAPEWHFIGRLQANKTGPIAARFAWVHGIDRLRIAQRLAAQRPPAMPPLNVCVQVKLTPDATKGGADAAQARALVRALRELPGLRLRGLMSMLPDGLGPQAQRARFRAVRELYEQLRREGAALDTLSMGMSGDFEAAIAEGATLVRIGSALFDLAPAASSP